MTKAMALHDIRTVQRMLRRGRRPISHNLRMEQADELGLLIACLEDESMFVDNGGVLISRTRATQILAEVSHFAFHREKALGMRISSLSVDIYTKATWDEEGGIVQ